MNRKHALIVAAALGLAALAGMVALTRTLHLGGAARTHVPQAQIVRRSRQLDRIEASLRRELRQRPPALPAAGGAPAPAPAQRVAYVRPKPIVVTLHRRGDDGGEYRAQGSDD